MSTVASAYRFLDGIEPLLGELSAAGVPMHALSNYPVWFEMIEARLGLSRYLRWSFVSCRTGVRKPDPEAFLGAARALGVAPSRCLFVDDREKNCAGARAVGIFCVRQRAGPAGVSPADNNRGRGGLVTRHRSALCWWHDLEQTARLGALQVSVHLWPDGPAAV